MTRERTILERHYTGDVQHATIADEARACIMDWLERGATGELRIEVEPAAKVEART